MAIEVKTKGSLTLVFIGKFRFCFRSFLFILCKSLLLRARQKSVFWVHFRVWIQLFFLNTGNSIHADLFARCHKPICIGNGVFANYSSCVLKLLACSIPPTLWLSAPVKGCMFLIWINFWRLNLLAVWTEMT